MKNKTSVEPLLYILQPEFEVVVANMQKDYNGGTGEEITIVKTEKLEINNQPSNSAFKDLTIPEKINYVTNLSREIPPIRCEVKVENHTYRGTIKEQTETEISIHVLGRGSENVNRKEIKGINLIGF